MAFNINTFKANGLTRGGARPTQFEIDIFPPFASVDSQRMRFLVQGGSLPAAIIGTVQVPYFGRAVKFAGDREYPAWTVQVLNDEDFAIRAIMERWSNEMNAHISNRMSDDMYATAYKTSAVVTQMGKNGEAIRSYRLVGAFPTGIQEIDLDWGKVNAVEIFGVEFQYDYWEPLNQNTSSTKYSPTLAGDAQVGGEISTVVDVNGSGGFNL